MAQWKIGDRIQNRWEIYRILGGGMGIVYIVYDHEWHEPFALKTFQDDIFAQDPKIATSFEWEALAWVNLDVHQNITQARFVQTIEGKPFLFLEFVSGGDLSDWIGTPRLMQDLPQVLSFAIQLCDGMIHAMSKGIKAHRDIKPKNCLITQDNTLKVTDFGLAKIFDETRMGESGRESQDRRQEAIELSTGMTCTGEGAGTREYIAPEQFDDVKHVDVRADIYSFGIMLFEMVTGRLPFEGGTWEEFERLHKNQAPPSLPATLPADLASVIHTCLSKDPSHRFEDFSSVRERLARSYEALTRKPAPQPVAGTQLDAEQLSNKGASLCELGRVEDAMACYDRAIEIDPRYAPAWYNKGDALLNLGRFDEGIACCDRTVEINPGLANAWYNKGWALRSLGRFEQAIECCDHAIGINPRYELAWCNKAVALGNLGRADEAIACYERAIEINPRYAMAWYNKGDALLNLGRSQEAIACCDRAIEINPRYAEAWFNKGAALGNRGRIKEALPCFEKAYHLGLSPAREAIDQCKRMLRRF